MWCIIMCNDVQLRALCLRVVGEMGGCVESHLNVKSTGYYYYADEKLRDRIGSIRNLSIRNTYLLENYLKNISFKFIENKYLNKN